jgi:hypothetical protein
MIGLGALPGYDFSVTRGIGSDPISGDGSTIVGSTFSDGNGEAFLHRAGSGMQGLAIDGSPYAVSLEGNVVVGHATREGNQQAFRWTEEDGAEYLGVLQGDVQSWAQDVTEDGSTIVGVSMPVGLHGGGEVFRWTEMEGMVALGFESLRIGTVVAASGEIIAGTTYGVEGNPYHYEPFLWTPESGVQRLGKLIDTEEGQTEVRDMTPDGRIIVGIGDDGNRSASTLRSFVWTENGGMQDFQSVLTDEYGLAQSLAGWNLAAVESVSANGQFFSGVGLNPSGNLEAWLVRLDAPWGVPEPSSAVLALIAFCSIAAFCRRLPGRGEGDVVRAQ